MLEGLLNNPAIIGMATKKLRGFIAEKGIKAFLIKPNAAQEKGPLPGFDILFFTEDVATITQTAYDDGVASNTTHPYRLTPEEWAQYQNLILKSTEL